MRKIRIAIVGVGNCASSLVQGINFYDGSSANGTRIGLMHRQVGGYRPSDIEIVAAFDIDRRKVGLDVSKAIFSPPNCTKVFCEKIKLTGAIVKMGCVLDGYAPHMRDQDPLRTFLPLEKESIREEIVAELKNSSAELMVNYLPVGSEQATRFYAGCALEAGLGFVNNIPVFIASDPTWSKRFADRNRRETFRRRFAELSRRRHRRHSLLQAGAGSRDRRRVAFRLRLLFKASARANDRRRSISLCRTIHPRRARKLSIASIPATFRSRFHSFASSV